MGLKRIKVDSILAIKDRKTNEQLAAENELLKNQMQSLREELDSTQIALCDVYEAVIGGE